MTKMYDITSPQGQLLLAHYDGKASPELADAVCALVDASIRDGSWRRCACGWSADTGADDEYIDSFLVSEHDDGETHDPDRCPLMAAIVAIEEREARLVEDLLRAME
jgi:hypothetical protein